MSNRLIVVMASYLLTLIFLLLIVGSVPLYLVFAGTFLLVFKRALAEKEGFALRVATIVLPCLVGISSIMFSSNFFDARSVETFLIGDSDSQLYYDVGASIARSTSFLDQLKVWNLSYLHDIQGALGMIFKDFGFFWLVGVIFTVVGVENGVPTLIVLNILMLSQSIVWLCSYVKPNQVRPVRPAFVLFCSALFYLNSAVGSALLSCRKDIVLLFVFSFCLHSLTQKRRFAGLTCLLPIFFLRAAFVVPAMAPVLINVVPFFRRISKRTLLGYSVVALFLIPFVYELLPAIGQLDSNSDAAFSLKRELGGSAIFLKSKALQFLYVLLTPLIPISVRAYQVDPLTWVSFVSGAGNVGLLYFSCRSVLQRSRLDDLVLDSYLLATLILYFAFAFLTAVGVSSGLYGVIEPRYKIAIWCMQLVLVVCAGRRVPRRQPAVRIGSTEVTATGAISNSKDGEPCVS